MLLVLLKKIAVQLQHKPLSTTCIGIQNNKRFLLNTIRKVQRKDGVVIRETISQAHQNTAK